MNDMKLELVRFGDLYAIPSKNGLSRPSATRGRGYKMINMGELFSNNIINDIEMELVEMSDKEKEIYFVKKNDLLFARQSMVASGAGKCSIINDIPINNITFESHIIRVRLKENIVDPWFYYYYFQLPYNPVKAIINQCAQAGIRGSELKKIRVMYPELSFQKNISNTLKKYDLLIEYNNKRIKILEQMAEELYKEWFVKMRFPDSQKYNFKSENPKGWILGNHNEMLIPEDWKFGKVADIGLFVRGKNITKGEMIEGEIPVISAGIQPSGYHNESNVKGYSLTMSASGANAGYLNYHLNDIWAADCSYYNNDSNIWFMYNSLNFIRKAIDNLQVGSAQPHVYPKNINKLSILIPEEKYILKFNELVKPFYEEIKVLKSKNDNLAKQRDLLLPRLMSGKLEVKESE